jgi:hypothetical protein
MLHPLGRAASKLLLKVNADYARFQSVSVIRAPFVRSFILTRKGGVWNEELKCS